MSSTLSTQNSLLLKKLLEFYNKDGNMEKILPIINGESVLPMDVMIEAITMIGERLGK